MNILIQELVDNRELTISIRTFNLLASRIEELDDIEDLRQDVDRVNNKVYLYYC